MKSLTDVCSRLYIINTFYNTRRAKLKMKDSLMHVLAVGIIENILSVPSYTGSSEPRSRENS